MQYRRRSSTKGHVGWFSPQCCLLRAAARPPGPSSCSNCASGLHPSSLRERLRRGRQKAPQLALPAAVAWSDQQHCKLLPNAQLSPFEPGLGCRVQTLDAVRYKLLLGSARHTVQQAWSTMSSEPRALALHQAKATVCTFGCARGEFGQQMGIDLNLTKSDKTNPWRLSDELEIRGNIGRTSCAPAVGSAHHLHLPWATTFLLLAAAPPMGGPAF